MAGGCGGGGAGPLLQLKAFSRGHVVVRAVGLRGSNCAGPDLRKAFWDSGWAGQGSHLSLPMTGEGIPGEAGLGWVGGRPEL